MLREFWQSFNEAIGGTSDLRVREVLDALNDLLGPHFFGLDDKGDLKRACLVAKTASCPSNSAGLQNLSAALITLIVNTRPLAVPNGEDDGSALTDNGPMELGFEPETGFAVTRRRGPYGYYIQLGEQEARKNQNGLLSPKI